MKSYSLWCDETLRRLLFIVLMTAGMIALQGCTTTQDAAVSGLPPGSSTQAIVNPDLAPPNLWNSTRHWLHEIEVRVPAQVTGGDPIEGKFMGQVERSAEREVMVGSSVSGWVYFQSIWDGKVLKVETKPGVPKAIDPAMVFSDMQMALWPEKRLSNWFAQSRRFAIRQSGTTRWVSKDNKRWLSIEYERMPCETGCSLTITHHQLGYELTIKNLSAQES